MANERRRPLLVDIALGLASGAAATWVMGKVTTVLYERESDEVRDRENEVRGGKSAYAIAAEKSAALAGHELTEDEQKKIGSAIHWALGIGAGALYGVLRNQIPAMGFGSGLAYGFAFWLLMDEAAMTLLGLTPPPQEFPWQTHARGLAGHLVFGMVSEAVFDVAGLAP